MKPETTLYKSSFGSRMYFGAPAPGWVGIGRRLDDPGRTELYEWTYLRVADLIELASAAEDATEELAAALPSGLFATSAENRSRAKEGLWRLGIAARRFGLRLIGYELVAYSGADVRWTLSYPKDDEATRRLAHEMLQESRDRDAFWKGAGST